MNKELKEFQKDYQEFVQKTNIDQQEINTQLLTYIAYRQWRQT